MWDLSSTGKGFGADFEKGFGETFGFVGDSASSVLKVAGSATGNGIDTLFSGLFGQNWPLYVAGIGAIALIVILK